MLKGSTNKEQFTDRKHPVHLPCIERHNQPVIIFLTVCTKNRKPILTSDGILKALVRSWERADGWQVGRYIVMPDHMHLFCSPVIGQTVALKQWIRYWKRLVSQACPEYKPVWQRDSWDRQLRDVGHYEEKWKYVVENPVRKGLVDCSDNWRWQGELNVLRW